MIIVLSIISCQKDNIINDENDEYGKVETSEESIITKNNGSRGSYNPGKPIDSLTSGGIDVYTAVISTLSNDSFYSDRFSFVSRNYILDTTNNDRLYFFESYDMEFYFLCVRITRDYQISESYIIDFIAGMDYDFYIETGIPIPFDVYTVYDTYAFSVELDIANSTYSIINYNREMLNPDNSSPNSYPDHGSVFCNVVMYTAALPWTTGLGMIGGPWGWGLSIALGFGATIISSYVCN